MLFANERGRRGAGSLRLRSMARQLPQKIQASSPEGEAWATFLLRQSFSFASKEEVYEHHSQENLAEL